MDPYEGQLWWVWMEGLDADSLQDALAQAREEVQLEVVSGVERRGIEPGVWRGSRTHFPVPYSLDLQPVERLFDKLRRQVEGQASGSLEARMQAVNELSRTWQQQPEKVHSLTAWPWMSSFVADLI